MAFRERLETMVRRELAAQALDCACRAYDRQYTDEEQEAAHVRWVRTGLEATRGASTQC